VPVTLWHSRTSAAGRHRPFEGLLLGLGVGFQAHGEIGHEAHAQFAGVEHRPVARDHARRLQRLHPAQRGRGAERHALGQGEVADPPVAGQITQYLAVFFVNVPSFVANCPRNTADCNFMPGRDGSGLRP
jgi:hypothetical protein